MNTVCVGSTPNSLAVLFPLITEWLEQALTMSSCITSWTSDCHSALVKVVCLKSECSYVCNKYASSKKYHEKFCETKRKKLYQQCLVRGLYTEWWEMLNHMLILLLVKIWRPKLVIFSDEAWFTFDRNTHGRRSSYWCYEGLSPVPWDALCDLNIRTWPAGAHFGKRVFGKNKSQLLL